jgi:hypothetical protein
VCLVGDQGNVGIHVGMNIDNVVDGNLRPSDGRIPFGNNIQQLSLRPRRKHLEANHLSGVGERIFHPAEHSLGVGKFRYDFEQLGLRVPEIFRHLRHAVIV